MFLSASERMRLVHCSSIRWTAATTEAGGDLSSEPIASHVAFTHESLGVPAALFSAALDFSSLRKESPRGLPKPVTLLRRPTLSAALLKPPDGEIVGDLLFP